MGVDFYIVNIDRKEYLDPSAFGDNEKIGGYMQGHHATALALLVCDPSGWSVAAPLGGTWCEDRVVAVYSGTPPNTHGFVTTTERQPKRNLYAMTWQEFKDVSRGAIAMLCGWIHDVPDELARRAVVDVSEVLLWYLGDVVAEWKCLQLRDALDRVVGPEWRAKYLAAKEHFEAMEEEERKLLNE